MNRHLLAAAGAAFAFVAMSGIARSDERPLIWQPIKNSNTSYAVKLGLRLPTRLEPEAGFDLGVNTTEKGGRVVDTPLVFWSRIKAVSITRPAYEMSRDIGVNLDGMAGSATISMNYYEKQIATPSFNVERHSTYAMHYSGEQGDWTGLEASQSIKLRRTATGTAFSASANSAGGFDTFGAGLGIEQKLGENITLSGSVNRSFSDADTVASVNANYSFKW
jgi:hypothetical protein